MKESTLIQIRNEVGRLQNLTHNLYQELTFQRQVNDALSTVCREMPGWDKAVEIVKAKNEKDISSEEVSPDAKSVANADTQEQKEVQPEEPKLDLGPKQE